MFSIKDNVMAKTWAALILIFSFVSGVFMNNALATCHWVYLCDAYGHCDYVQVCDNSLDLPTVRLKPLPRITPIVPPEPPSIEPIPPIGAGRGHHLYNPDNRKWDWYWEPDDVPEENKW